MFRFLKHSSKCALSYSLERIPWHYLFRSLAFFDFRSTYLSLEQISAQVCILAFQVQHYQDQRLSWLRRVNRENSTGWNVTNIMNGYVFCTLLSNCPLFQISRENISRVIPLELEVPKGIMMRVISLEKHGLGWIKHFHPALCRFDR